MLMFSLRETSIIILKYKEDRGAGNRSQQIYPFASGRKIALSFIP